METEAKWAFIAFFFLIGVPMVGFGIEKYQIHQCRVEAIKVAMDPDKISQVCK